MTPAITANSADPVCTARITLIATATTGMNAFFRIFKPRGPESHARGRGR